MSDPSVHVVVSALKATRLEVRGAALRNPYDRLWSGGGPRVLGSGI